MVYYAALSGATLTVARRPSVGPSRASDFLEIGKPQKLPI